MPRPSLTVLREVHQSLREWLCEARHSPESPAYAPGVLQQISQKLEQVDQPLRDGPAAVTEGDGWKAELAAYGETLREVRARLANLDIALRIHAAQMGQARMQLSAVRSWSDLAKQIG